MINSILLAGMDSTAEGRKDEKDARATKYRIKAIMAMGI